MECCSKRDLAGILAGNFLISLKVLFMLPGLFSCLVAAQDGPVIFMTVLHCFYGILVLHLYVSLCTALIFYMSRYFVNIFILKNNNNRILDGRIRIKEMKVMK